MKKLLVLFLLLSATFAFAQKGTYDFVESIDEFTIGKTFYDYNTNSGGPRNQMIVWEDGWISSTFMDAQDQAFVTRGNGYAYFDGNTWHQSTGKIEPIKTGYGTMSRFGANGVILCSHYDTGSGLNLYLMKSNNRTGDNWEVMSIPAPTPAGFTLGWPSIITSGPNRDIIHILAAGQNVPYKHLFYCRSLNGGLTWDKLYVPVPFCTPADVFQIAANKYYFLETTTIDGVERISFVVNGNTTHGQVVYSDDDGNTWQRKMFYEHPYPLEADNYPPWEQRFYLSRNAAAVWGTDGVLHVISEYNATGNEPDMGYYGPLLGGIIYWNSEMPTRNAAYMSAIHDANWIFGAPMAPIPPEFFGYVPPMDQDTELPDNDVDLTTKVDGADLAWAHGQYAVGNVSFPSITIDPVTNTVYAVYASVTEFTVSWPAEMSYYNIFARATQDNGQTWSNIEMLTKGFTHVDIEHVFPWMPCNTINSNNREYLQIMYQHDPYPGNFVQGDHPDSNDNYFHVLRVKLANGTPSCPGIQNLAFSYDEDTEDLTFTWDPPTALTPIEYDIYKDGAYLDKTQETQFVVAHNPGQYCVRAIFEEDVCSGYKNICVSVPPLGSVNETVKTNFSIAPNPAQNSITITAGNSFHTLEVVNFLGQTIHSQSNMGNKATIDVSMFSPGVYFVRIINTNGATVNKFVKN
jgi:hypothetical protein